jgi:hypothetical protein
MSITAVRWALRAKIDDPIQKLALTAIAECHNAKTGECFPSQAYIAEVIGRKERSVRSYLAALEQAGFYSRKPRYDRHGKRTSDSFVLNLERTEAATTGKRIAGSLPAEAFAGSEAVLPAKNETTTGKLVAATESLNRNLRTGNLSLSGRAARAPHAHQDLKAIFQTVDTILGNQSNGTERLTITGIITLAERDKSLRAVNHADIQRLVRAGLLDRDGDYITVAPQPAMTAAA